MRITFDPEQAKIETVDDGIPVSLVIMGEDAVIVFDQGGRQKGSQKQKDYARRWLELSFKKTKATNAALLEAAKEVLMDLDGRRLPVQQERKDQLRAAIAAAEGVGDGD